MKVKEGDRVLGECGSGEVVKTTKMWCVYKS